MGVPVKTRRKMEYGKKIQDKEKRRLLERKTIYGFSREDVEQIIQKLQIENTEVGLKGQIDTVLKMKNGQMVPVDTKYTDEIQIYRPFRKQIIAYAILLDHEFKTNTTMGILYFAKQKKIRKVKITREDKVHILREIEKIRQLMRSEKMPRKTSSDKCGYCEVKKYCV
jgi:CRISPR-associated exonuclease Cas4